MALDDVWQRTVLWCERYAPVTAAAVHAPATSEVLIAVERETGLDWPPDLVAWYRLADGCDRSPAGYLLPGYRPLPLAEMLSRRADRTQFREQVRAEAQARPADPLALAFGGAAEDPYDIDAPERQPAGTPAGLFLSSFLPIAEDQSGSDLFVDTRTGALQGCVTAFVPGDADNAGPQWSSVEAMLTAVSKGLSVGEVAPYTVLIEAGVLEWTVS